MSAIERWQVYRCPVCGYVGGAPECAGPRDHHALIPSEPVEVVPADQLRGAVEALDEMRAVLANLREVAINGGAMKAGGGYDVTVLRPLLGGPS